MNKQDNWKIKQMHPKLVSKIKIVDTEHLSRNQNNYYIQLTQQEFQTSGDLTNLLKRELLINQKCQEKTCSHHKIVSKGVQVTVIGSPNYWVKPHVPNNCQRACNEHYFHSGVINRNELGKQIEVPSQEDNCIQFLSL